MIVTTTPTVEGRPVQEYLGIVSGECVLKEGVFSGKEGWADTVLEGRRQATARMVQRAKALGANAVVGVSSDLEFMSAIHYMMVTGTAVVIP